MLFLRRRGIHESLDLIARQAVQQMGFGPVGDIRMVYSDSTANPYLHFRDKVYESGIHTTLTLAVAAMTANRNDVCLLTPESHTQGASLTWSKAMTHLVGLYPSSMMSQRARIGHNANFDKLLDITGAGCFFANLFLMYGRGNASNLTALNIGANRITMKNCHIGSPMNATEGDQATFKVVKIAEAAAGDGLEHFFDHCTFGVDTVAWTNGTMFKIAGTPRLVFEDCTFLMRADNAQVTFLDGTVGDGDGFILFKNCAGINLGTALTVALGSTGWGTNTDIILLNSGFSGATDLIAAADEAKAIMLAGSGILTDEQVGLGIAFDHTA